MTAESHFRAIEKMYLAAPINRFFLPKIEVREGEARIKIAVKEDFFHSAGAVHGSVYFKMLDDAAYFAASSCEPEYFLLTSTFTTYLTAPVSSGIIEAVGKVVHRGRNQWLAEAVAYNSGQEIARGSGIFVRGKALLCGAKGHRLK